MSTTNSEDIERIVTESIQQLNQCRTIEDLRRASDDLGAKVGRGTKRARPAPVEDRADLERELLRIRKAIRGKFAPKLKSRTSKMVIHVPVLSPLHFAALVGKDASALHKRGAYYEMEPVSPAELLPGVFDPGLPEKGRFWYNSIDPESGCVRSLNGFPKTLNTAKACELRYKPSSKELSVTAWNIEIHSWERCCNGNPSI